MRSPALLAAVSLSALANAAAAQTAGPASPPVSTVEEIVVTAAPFDITEEQTTANVDVLTRETLDVLPAAGLGDVLAGLPGVRSTSFAPGASRPVIRGLAGPRVQVLTNGLGQIDASTLSPDHAVASDPAEASRIEVIRGPSTLRYGGSAIGGVVNVLDERIPTTPAVGGVDGRVAASGSTVDDGYSVAGSAKLGDGPLLFSVDATRRESDDYAIPAGRLSQPLADLLGVERDRQETVVNSASTLTQYGAGVSYTSGLGLFGLSAKRVESEYGTVAEEEVTIDLEQTRVDFRGELNADLGLFDRVLISAGYADYTHTEFEGAEVGTRFFNEGVEGRLELVQRERGGWQGAVGVQGLRRDFDAAGEEAYVPGTKISEYGLFTLQRLDRGTYGFEGGLRIDGRELDSLAGQRDFTNVSASAGVFFQPTDALYYGLSLSRTARAPTETELFAEGPHVATGSFEIGNADLKSEVSTSVELAGHYEAGRLSLDGHAFYAQFSDFIDLRPTGEIEDDLPVFLYVATDADFYGVEAEASYAVWREGPRELRLEGVYDWVEADSDLGHPARIPPWSVTTRLVYDSPVVQGRLELRHVSDQDRTAEFELPTDDYTLLNAFVSYKPFQSDDTLGGVTLYLDGRNLTDEEAREHASFLKDIAPQPGRNLRAGVIFSY
jgi:iron complex outermembrane receptor protein